ncbi:unnamed protein product [Leptidea sinapis]|uniref:Uncharacterized protein n=1 Tax=Leptidea sinapis TaxID=189913 RepID=A0A5E4R4G0_9NEOP|nr:unnamed protein product [Leptidea sinapis]
MITVFNTIDPEQIPMFVAYEIHKWPPLCFDHVDVTKLLKHLLVLQSDVNAFKSDYVTKEQLKDMKLDERKSKSIKSNNYINTKRGGYIEEDCSIVDVPPNVACASVQSEPSASSKTMNHERVSAEPMYTSLTLAHSSRSTTIPISENHRPVSRQQSKQQTMAEIVRNAVFYSVLVPAAVHSRENTDRRTQRQTSAYKLIR